MDSSSLLRFPYKIAQKLNRPYSRYKTDDSTPHHQTTTSAQYYKRASEPVYQEIDDFPTSLSKDDSSDLKRNSQSTRRQTPKKPLPYSGSLISRSIDIMSEEVLAHEEEPATIERNSVEFRERCKSSSFLEERITSQLYVSQHNNRTSLDSSNYSVNSSTPSINSSCSISIEESPSHESTGNNNNNGNKTHDGSSNNDSKGKSVKRYISSKSLDLHTSGTQQDSELESDTYVQMAPVQSIKESFSTPLLSEDNVYVTMSPVTKHKNNNYISHDYYNLKNTSSTNSLPNLTRKQTTPTKDSDTPTKSDDDSKDTPTEDIYESVDYSRPLPPPRRKKNLRLHSSVHCVTPPPQTSPILRHHSLIPTSNDSSRLSEYIRDRTSTSPVNIRKSPKKGRGRPIGMIFNDDTISEVPLVGVAVQQQVTESCTS